MKLLTWNVNHRAVRKEIPFQMAEAIASLSPDVIVLTEYVPGPSHRIFLKQLVSKGFTHIEISQRAPKENQVLIAANTTLISGNIGAPINIEKSVPSNILHVRLLEKGVDVLGLRIPDYSKQPIIKHKCWDWIINTATDNKDRPFVIIGDFNTDPDYSHSRCGDRICQLIDEGWQHAMPKSGASYWAITNGSGKRLDHAFISKHFDVLDAKYISESGYYVFAGKNSEAMSDHAILLVEIHFNSKTE